tara:strand:+ start:443 stop:808 length:366 start_codon:yes stop_codon:yes gene_type:complete
MPKFKKPSGFKMKGFSYPGKSPLKVERDPEEFARRIRPGLEPGEQGPIEEPNVDDIEGLTDEQKEGVTNMLDEVKKGADKFTKDARKRQSEHLRKMNFAHQRSKFSKGTAPSVYTPTGLPS